MSATPFVTYDAFDVQNLRAGDRIEKPVPVKPGQPAGSKYHEIPLFYQFPSNVEGVPATMGSLRIEFPEMVSNGGVVEKIGQSGRPEFSIMSRIPQAGATLRLTQTLNNLHAGCAHYLNQVKGAVGMPLFSTQAPEATGFKNLIVLSRDKTTGEVRAGFDPQIYIKLMKRGFGATEEKSLFTGLDGKPIAWDLLKGVEMRYIPLVEFTNIYASGKASIQFKLISAVVTSVVKKNTETTQTETIARITASNPEAISMLESQIAKLMQYRDQMVAASAPTAALTVTGAPPAVSAPTEEASGLTALPPQTSPQLQSAPVPQAPSMSAFLAQAPALPAMPAGGAPTPVLRFQ